MLIETNRWFPFNRQKGKLLVPKVLPKEETNEFSRIQQMSAEIPFKLWTMKEKNILMEILGSVQVLEKSWCFCREISWSYFANFDRWKMGMIKQIRSISQKLIFLSSRFFKKIILNSLSLKGFYTDFVCHCESKERNRLYFHPIIKNNKNTVFGQHMGG